MSKKTTYNPKYYNRQDYDTYDLNVKKIIDDFGTLSKYATHIGVSRETIYKYRDKKFSITEKSSNFNKLEGYIEPNGSTFQEEKLKRLKNNKLKKVK